jgi:hypothetical protein
MVFAARSLAGNAPIAEDDRCIGSEFRHALANYTACPAIPGVIAAVFWVME